MFEGPEELLDGLDLTPPALSLEPEPGLEAARVASPAHARATLVAEADEAEDLRRRITGPISGPDYEMSLDEISAPEPMEEITLDSEPLPTFEPESEPDPFDPTMAPLALDEAQELPPPVPARSAATVASRSGRRSEPPPLVIEVEAGGTDVTVPVELHVEPGVEQVIVNLRLVLSIQR